VSGWQRVQKRNAPDWLYELIGKKGSSYWVRYRKGNARFERRIEGRIDSWLDAHRIGQKMLDEYRPTTAPNASEAMPGAMARCEDLCEEIVAQKRALSAATFEQTKIFMRKHLIPWLKANCPNAKDLNPTIWARYKADKRIANPRIALFNHWKFFVMLFKYAHEKGALKEKFKLVFKEKREDFRARGLIISDDHIDLLMKYGNQVWRDRIMLQRVTGMRPGEARGLRIDRVNLVTGVIKLLAEDTKTRTEREFTILDPDVLAMLRKRATAAQGSPFFFPSRANRQVAMDRALTGWDGAIAKANKELAERREPAMPDYTPHDLRHTWLSVMFRGGESPGLICFYAGLSIDEAQKTYLHFTAADTLGIARAAENMRRSGKSLGSDTRKSGE
jgi:integrase